MESHAYLERIEDGVAVLELRLTAIDYVPPEDAVLKRRFRYPRKKVEISAQELLNIIPQIKERDVLVVEHVDGEIQRFCYIDEVETQLRVERAQARKRRLESKMQRKNTES